METKILREVRVFLRKHRMPASLLAELAGVPQPTLSRLLTGRRPDIMSRNADALREAMWRYEAGQQSYRQSGEED